MVPWLYNAVPIFMGRRSNHAFGYARYERRIFRVVGRRRCSLVRGPCRRPEAVALRLAGLAHALLAVTHVLVLRISQNFVVPGSCKLTSSAHDIHRYLPPRASSCAARHPAVVHSRNYFGFETLPRLRFSAFAFSRWFCVLHTIILFTTLTRVMRRSL